MRAVGCRAACQSSKPGVGMAIYLTTILCTRTVGKQLLHMRLPDSGGEPLSTICRGHLRGRSHGLRRLVRAVCRKHRRQGLQHQLQIEPIIAASNIRQVHLKLFRKRQSAPTRNLPNASQAGFNQESLHIVERVAFDFLHNRRPRPNDAHAAAQHVPQLGHFVEARPAQDSADPRPRPLCDDALPLRGRNARS